MKGVSRDHDPGVGKGKDRHDQKGDPRVERMFHLLQGRLHLFTDILNFKHGALLQFNVLLRFSPVLTQLELLEEVAYLRQEGWPIDAAARGNGHSDEDA